MPVTLPIEVYEVLERVVGKENAKVVIKSIESTISENTEYKWKVSKDEILDVMRKEFVTKDLGVDIKIVYMYHPVCLRQTLLYERRNFKSFYLTTL
jgi:hypothetical protein